MTGIQSNLLEYNYLHWIRLKNKLAHIHLRVNTRRVEMKIR